jgi:site-specific DNA-cytosine methylase
MELKALSLFSGIGGLDLAAEMAGIKVIGFCEIEPFPVEVLKKRFPDVPIFGDVRKLKRGDIDGTIDIIHGGFPCQDLSQAGKQRGLEGERSGLWFEMLRVISEFRPRYVVAENVRGAVNLALDTVYSGLVNEGYKVYPYVISASAVGAPHQRERLFVVGVREDVHRQYTEAIENTHSELLQGGSEQREMGRETSEGIASNTQFSSGTLWPTPNCRDTRRGCRQFQLTHAVDLQNESDKGGTLWPTPQAVDGSAGGIISPDDTYVQKASGLFRKINRNGTDGSVGLARMVKLWPTPTSTERSGINPNTGSGAGLSKTVQLWPTPRAQEPGRTTEGYGRGLQELVEGKEQRKLWPTPKQFMYKDSITDRNKGNIGEKVGGQLNPDWVEQLMNFPEGWTDLEVDEPSKWVGWPALLGQEQYPYEFPRTTTGCKDRAKRLKALGNAVVSAQAYPFFRAIVEIERVLKEVS